MCIYLNVCAHWACRKWWDMKLQKKYRRKMCGAVFSLFCSIKMIVSCLYLRNGSSWWTFKDKVGGIQCNSFVWFLIIEPTRCTNFLKFYFEMKLYMFQTVPLSIIRSFSLQAVSKPVWHIPLLCVQWKTPDDGQRNCSKHAEFHSEIRFWEISASSWFYYKKEKHTSESAWSRRN